MIKKLRKLLGISYYDLHEMTERKTDDYNENFVRFDDRTITRYWTFKNPFNGNKTVIRKQKIQ